MAEMSDAEREQALKQMIAGIVDSEEETIRQQLRSGNKSLDAMIAEDCAVAEKDADLMNLYRAGVEQMDATPEGQLGFSDEMDRLARIIFPGRFVDHLAVLAKNSKDPNLAELQKSVIEGLSRAEMELMTAVVCSIIALYLRDYPERSANLQGMYQLSRMMSKQHDSQCNIL